MSDNNKVQQEQNVESTESTESTEFQNKATREFLQDKTGNPGLKTMVDDSTSRLPDDQNRLITQHNLRK